MMLRKRVSAKQITTLKKKITAWSRYLLPHSSVKRYQDYTTPDSRRSKNSRVLSANKARSLLDVGKPYKRQEKTIEYYFLHETAVGLSSQTSPGTNNISVSTWSPDSSRGEDTTAELKNTFIEKELKRRFRKPFRPSRLFSVPNHKDLGSTKRNSVLHSDQSKKLSSSSGNGLMMRKDMSKTPHRKLSESENHNFLISNPKSYEDSMLSEEECHCQVLKNSNHISETSPQTPRSLSRHQPQFVYCSPPPSRIVTRSQLRANPPGAPRALFRFEMNSYVPSLLYQMTQEHQSSSELDDTSAK